METDEGRFLRVKPLYELLNSVNCLTCFLFPVKQMTLKLMPGRKKFDQPSIMTE